MITKKTFWLILAVFNFANGMQPAPEGSISSELKRLIAHVKDCTQPSPTTAAECRQCGYNGLKIPIRKGSRAALASAGFILDGAQPSMLGGYWCADSALPVKLLFLEDNNLKYEARIKERETDTKILASYLVYKGITSTMEHDLAIMWEDGASYNTRTYDYTGRPVPTKLYITLVRLAQMQEQENVIDLEKNKVELTDESFI